MSRRGPSDVANSGVVVERLQQELEVYQGIMNKCVLEQQYVNNEDNVDVPPSVLKSVLNQLQSTCLVIEKLELQIKVETLCHLLAIKQEEDKIIDYVVSNRMNHIEICSEDRQRISDSCADELVRSTLADLHVIDGKGDTDSTKKEPVAADEKVEVT